MPSGRPCWSPATSSGRPRRDADARAQMIVVGAIQRIASDQTSESWSLPFTCRGRHEGPDHRPRGPQYPGVRAGDRRQRDDRRHPESVLLSCFDPVRRETARITLTELVKDGRIHGPDRGDARRSKNQIEAQCLRAAEDAMTEVGISDLHPALIPVLGTLALPDLVRPERAQAPGGVRPHRRADGRGTRTRHRQCKRCAFCTTSARR